MSIPIENPASLSERVRTLYESGLQRGSSTGWRSVDELYTVASRQWTLVTGIPGMGKSEWLDALLVNLAGLGDWTFAIYSPENFPSEIHVAKIIEKRLGLPFNRGPSERMTTAQLREGQDWVHEHFMWLDPKYPSYVSLMEAASKFRCANKNFGVVIDPWNALEHLRPKDRTETEYICAALTDITCWVREENIHCWLVAHPSKLSRDASGNRPVPTPYDIQGSAHWFNKADNIVTVHRDKIADTQDVDIHVQKIRHKSVGRVGLATLKYDRVCGRYFEQPPLRVIEGRNYADR